MQLIRDGRFVCDRWIRIGAETASEGGDSNPAAGCEPADDGRPTLVRGSEIGFDLDPDTPMDRMRHLAKHAALLVVRFPSPTDGRGFSVARTLRDSGFGGELRASGPLIADQYDFLLRSGFDSVEIPRALAKRQPEKFWRDGMNGLGDTYQPRDAEHRAILRRRHATTLGSTERTHAGGESLP